MIKISCDQIVDSYSESNFESPDGVHNFRCNFPCGGAPFQVALCAQGQSFTTPSSPRYGLCEAKFYMRRYGNPNGNLKAYLYEESGDKPTGSALATSNTVAMSSLGTSFSLITFVFPTPYYCMEASHEYVIFVGAIDCTNFELNTYLQVGYDNTSPTHSGRMCYQQCSQPWDNYSTRDTIFYVYGETCATTTTLYDEDEEVKRKFRGKYPLVEPSKRGGIVVALNKSKKA